QANVSFRMEPRHANSRSSARRLRPRASSSAPIGPAGLCGPAPSTTRRREPTSEIMQGEMWLFPRGTTSISVRILSLMFARGTWVKRQGATRQINHDRSPDGSAGAHCGKLRDRNSEFSVMIRAGMVATRHGILGVEDFHVENCNLV